MPRFAPDDLQRFASDVLAAAGASPPVAAAVAAHLVDCNLKGVDSHGVGRIPSYLKLIGEGYIDPAAVPAVQRDDPQVVRVDGGGGFGIVAMEAALDALLAPESAMTIAVAGITNVAHTGRIGAYAERAAAANRFALVTGGGAYGKIRYVAPFGGAEAFYSTNPYALALPGGRHGPVVADFATSATAQGKLMLSRAKGETVEPGLIIDKAGAPTIDPERFYDGGAILPAAGPKGYGLALIAELLGVALLGPRHEFNWLMIVIDIARMQDPGDYNAAAETLLAQIKAVQPSPGFEEVCLPGELEERRAAERRRDGVPVDAQVWEGIAAAGAGLDVAAPTALVS